MSMTGSEVTASGIPVSAVTGSGVTTSGLKQAGRVPSPARLLRVGLGLLLLALASALLNNQSYNVSGVSLIWLPNGLLIGVLLCTARRQWAAFLCMGYAVDVCVNMALGQPFLTSGYMSICNMTEVIVAAVCMQKTIAPEADLTESRQLRSLMLYGGLLAPAIAACMATFYLKLHSGIPLSQSLRFWFAADLLGIVTVTPLYLSYHQGRRFSSRSWAEVAGLFLLLTSVSFAVFRADTYPLLWLVMLCLLLLGVRLGFTGSALGLLLVIFIGGFFTIRGHGPIGLTGARPIEARILLFQIFIAFCMCALYVTEAARSANRRVLVRLAASESRFRSMAEASRDVIVLAGLDGIPIYVSPAITELVGWEPEEFVGIHYRQVTHAEDVAEVKESLREMLAGGETGPLSYRLLKKDGGYLWTEATTRLMRQDESGAASGFVYVLRDITDRKAAEEHMQTAYDTVERLAMMDGLTGVANRRLLDETLQREWLSARRDSVPLSVLLIDVDYFKAYNDCYGHLAGDECLRRIAVEIQSVLRRPLDLLARYGGEEFVAVLPNTPAQSAELVAERVREAIEACGMVHAESPGGVVTVSLGCATALPAAATGQNALLKAADTALYLAKANGRNRHETAPADLLLQ